MLSLCLLVVVGLASGQETHGDHECGGSGGSETWSDDLLYHQYGAITKIEVWHRDVISGLRFTYGTYPSEVRGSDNRGDDLFTYNLGPGESIVGSRMSYGDDGDLGNDEVLCKLKFYIMRPDDSIFSLQILGGCNREEIECDEYIPGVPLMYSSGRYNNYIDFLRLTYEDVPSE